MIVRVSFLFRAGAALSAAAHDGAAIDGLRPGSLAPEPARLVWRAIAVLWWASPESRLYHAVQKRAPPCRIRLKLFTLENTLLIDKLGMLQPVDAAGFQAAARLALW